MSQQPSSNTPEKRSNIEIMKSTINAPSVQEQFQNALGENKGLFVSSLIDLYATSSLKNCAPKDVIMEALKAAVLKLPINKSLGFAWIVPYKDKPNFQVGYKGYIQLAMRSGQYRTINADTVYEGEEIITNKVSGMVAISGEAKNENPKGYFAHFELLNGFYKTIYWSKEKVIAHAKKYSASYNHKDSAWKTDFDAMARKTLLKHILSIYGILSVDMIAAFDRDQDAESARDQEVGSRNAKQAFHEGDISDVEPMKDQEIGDGKKPGTAPDPGF